MAHLPAGKYTVVIGEAENYFSQPGQRVFDVSCGEKALANNFDIIASAGGPEEPASSPGRWSIWMIPFAGH